MSKKVILSSLKWGFAIGIIYLLIRSGKLDLNEMLVFLKQPKALGTCLLLVSATYLLCFFRWKTLLAGQSIDLPYFQCLKLGMLGMFFSTVIPGTVGGDLVKAIYVGRRFPKKKLASISTIFLDRVLGLVAMIILGGLAFLVGYPQISELQTPSGLLISSMGLAVALLALFFVVSMGIFTIFHRRLPASLPERLLSLPLMSKLEHLYEVVLGYKERPDVLWKAIGISMLSHSCNMGVMFTVAHAVHGPQPWGVLSDGSFVLASILGMCAMAIPVAPMGLGVGQYAFGTVFFALGAPTASFGVPIVSGFQIVSIIMNLTGSVFFATYKHEVHDHGIAAGNMA